MIFIIPLHFPIGSFKYLLMMDAITSDPPVLKPERYIIPLDIPIKIEQTRSIKKSLLILPTKYFDKGSVNETIFVKIIEPIIV